MTYLDLILNLALLVAFSIVSGFIEQYWARHTRIGKIAQGMLFGGVAALGMLRPFQLEPGFFFDGRSVILSICALFYGPLTATISCVVTLACRLMIGGSGMVAVMLIILSSTAVGLAAHYLFRASGRPLAVRHLFVFGIVVHLVVLIMAFALSFEKALIVTQRIRFPVLIFYPLATILVGKILLDQESKQHFIDSLQQAREQLDTTLRSIQHAVISVDTMGRILYMNPVAEALTGWNSADAHHKMLAEVVRVVDQKNHEQFIDPVVRILETGEPVQITNDTLLLERNGTKHNISKNAAPMHDAKGKLTGAVLVFRDVTAEYETREQLHNSPLKNPVTL